MTSTILGFLPRIYYAPEGSGGQPEPAPAPTAQTDDDAFEEEEVVIPPEEGGEGGEEEPPAAEAPPAQPPKKRGPKRYAALTHERDQARSFAEQVSAENAELRRRAEAAEKAATESQDVAMATYEKSTKTQLASAEKEYEEAITTQDAPRITAATKALTSAQTAMDDIEAVKRQKPADPPKPQEQQRQQPQPQPQQAPDLPPDVKDFVLQHRWFDAVARDAQGRPLVDRASGQFAGNPDFDADMHSEAVLFSKKLERQIAAGSKKFAVSSPEYFQAVEEHMREEFPDYFDDDGAPAPPAIPAAKRGSPVAGPGSKNLPGAPAKGNDTSYKLSADEIRFITKSVQNGGGPKYPKGHKQEFKPMSLADAKVSFARRKISQAKEAQQ